DPRAAVAGDQVPVTGRGAADHVPRRGAASLHADAVARVAAGEGAGDVRADVVALDLVVVGPGIDDAHAVLTVARDHVRAPRLADDVRGRPLADRDAGHVGAGQAPAAVEAQDVADHDVARGAGADDVHPVEAVPGDHLAVRPG